VIGHVIDTQHVRIPVRSEWRFSRKTHFENCSSPSLYI
jgi:hypothetical protein